LNASMHRRVSAISCALAPMCDVYTRSWARCRPPPSVPVWSNCGRTRTARP